MSTTLLVLFSLTVAGFFLFALCSNLIYWYETLNTPDARIPSPRPGLVVCLRMYFACLGGYFLCVGLFPFAPFIRRKPGRAAKGEKAGLPPVILVHGLNNNAAVWLYIARRLEKAGYRVSTFSYSSFFVPLEKIMEGLDAHVRLVRDAADGRRPLFVCHSLGGLLVRRWLMAEGNSARCGGLVTLSTPHQGSKMAALAPGRTGQSIRPTASLILELRAAEARMRDEGAGLLRTALASPTDEAVLPSVGLVPPLPPDGGWKLRITPRTGHFTMLFWPGVGDMLLEELASCQARPEEG
ncbi:alpha/beta hydrolase [Desulfovibrio sp. OttesenSCG-928-A18]|nr:alpha/beta hydrolase [Desulfovibrio sp. OttesenSCG-928-A18]